VITSKRSKGGGRFFYAKGRIQRNDSNRKKPNWETCFFWPQQMTWLAMNVFLCVVMDWCCFGFCLSVFGRWVCVVLNRF
jgi:hypothetical protein